MFELEEAGEVNEQNIDEKFYFETDVLLGDEMNRKTNVFFDAINLLGFFIVSTIISCGLTGSPLFINFYSKFKLASLFGYYQSDFPNIIISGFFTIFAYFLNIFIAKSLFWKNKRLCKACVIIAIVESIISLLLLLLFWNLLLMS